MRVNLTILATIHKWNGFYLLKISPGISRSNRQALYAILRVDRDR